MLIYTLLTAPRRLPRLLAGYEDAVVFFIAAHGAFDEAGGKPQVGFAGAALQPGAVYRRLVSATATPRSEDPPFGDVLETHLVIRLAGKF